MDWVQLFFAFNVLAPAIVFGGFALLIGGLLLAAKIEDWMRKRK